MGDKQDRGWSRPGVIVATGTFVVAFATFWLTFAIGYTGSPGFRAWVASMVATMGPVAANGLSVLLSVGGAVLAGMLAQWVNYRAEQSNWRDRSKKWGTEKYVSAVCRAAGPVRDMVVVELSRETADPPEGRLERRMKRLLASLDDDQLQVYETFVEEFRASTGVQHTLVRAADVGFRPLTSASEMDKRLRTACEKLGAVGLLPDLTWADTALGLYAAARVRNEVLGIKADVILRMVREELRSRGIPPRHS